MATQKAQLVYADDSTHEVVITTGDKIRAARWAADERKKRDFEDQEQTAYAAYLAAKRSGLPHTEGSDEDGFLDFADNVAEIDYKLTEEMVTKLEAAGEINAEQAAAMRKLVELEEATDAGEAQATPA